MTSESSREVPLAATAAVFVPGTPFRTSAVQTQATVGPQLLNYTILETAPCSPGGLPTHTTKVRFDEIASDIIFGPSVSKDISLLKFGYSEKATKFEKIFHVKFDVTE